MRILNLLSEGKSLEWYNYGGKMIDYFQDLVFGGTTGW